MFNAELTVKKYQLGTKSQEIWGGGGGGGGQVFFCTNKLGCLGIVLWNFTELVDG